LDIALYKINIIIK